jgi:hypothetical protein
MRREYESIGDTIVQLRDQGCSGLIAGVSLMRMLSHPREVAELIEQAAAKAKWDR